MPQIHYGLGHLFLTRRDIANGTPRRLGIIQEVTVDFKYDTKELFGGQKFAVDVAQGKNSISWKAKAGAINGRIMSEFAFGAAPTTGLIAGQNNETYTVPTTPYQVTVNASASFYEDLGVEYGTGGTTLEKVASSPAQGQYSCANGVYTFAAADVGQSIRISYSFTATGGLPNSRITVVNQDMGAIPPFSLFLMPNQYRAKQSILKLYANTLEGMSLPYKMDDYMLMDLSGKAFADDSGKVFDFSASN